MLKSTYKPAAGAQSEPALPPGWTEHKAPLGHSYYYNTETKQSTYSRPAAEPAAPSPQPVASTPAFPPQYGRWNQSSGAPGSALKFNFPGTERQGDFRGGRSYQDRDRRYRQPDDRPRSKHTIPGCEPWLLVKTKLGRRFVYNPEDNESFWKFPEDVLKGVVQYDRRERERKERRERGEAGVEEVENGGVEEPGDRYGGPPATTTQPPERRREDEDDGDEFEEVEVTDDEDDENPSKKPKTDHDAEAEADQPLELGEDDIAYQLTQMGHDYGLDPGEYGDGEDEAWEEGAEGLPLTEEDSAALFRDLFEDFRVNPYRTWEQIIEEGRIIEDTRYVALPTTKARRDFYSQWSKERIQELRAQREKEEKRDPKIKYVAFLQAHATPKLYWPEFRRKFKKEPEMKDTQLSDKEKEKLYRDHINRLKLPESTRKSDLSALLKGVPLQGLNRGSTRDTLPLVVVTDLRYISLSPEVRDPLIETYISTLLPAPEPSGASSEDLEEIQKKKAERERREKALAERGKQVMEEKRRQQGQLRQGRETLGREEAEIDQAMRVARGKGGLRGYMEVDEEDSRDE